MEDRSAGWEMEVSLDWYMMDVWTTGEVKNHDHPFY